MGAFINELLSRKQAKSFAIHQLQHNNMRQSNRKVIAEDRKGACSKTIPSVDYLPRLSMPQHLHQLPSFHPHWVGGVETGK